MVMVYVAAVLTLNETVPPTFTLMSVAKPWIVASSLPPTSQAEGGDPGLEFSQTTGFVGAAHGSVLLADAELAGSPTSVSVVSSMMTTAATRRSPRPHPACRYMLRE